MDSTFTAILASWSFAPWLALALGLSAAIYTRGWLRLRRRGARYFGPRHLTCFLAGLGTIALALMSPLDALAPLLMQAHMVQHLLLMIVAPPLIWLAAPELPMIAGLPIWVRRTWLVPLWQLPSLRALGAWLTHPATAWIIAVAFLWLWHVPAMYKWTLKDRWIHDIEHFNFLLSSLLFWFPVVTPYPHRRAHSVWLLLPYLFLAGVQGSVLSGLLTFADHVVYPHYEQVPRLGSISALSDQAIGGALMWTLGSLAYLIPLVLIGRTVLRSSVAVQPQPLPCFSHLPLTPPVLLASGLAIAGFDSPPIQEVGIQCHGTGKTSGTQKEDTSQVLKLCRGAGASQSTHHAPRDARSAHYIPAPAHSLLPILTTETSSSARHQSVDLLRIPVLGNMLRRSQTRRAMQCILLAAAVIVVIDGFLGPQLAPVNVAGVGPWIHWRFLLVIGILAAGNLFCMACPFTLTRRMAAAWLPTAWTWPRWLANKGPAIALLMLFFWAYELFALWDSPWWTAWIVLGYFAAALAINGLFRGTPFCRYVCPIGQFNFVYSLISPLEVKVRDPQVCQSCHSHACLRGSETHPGCEMGLFQPQKQGNLDCTFCLDCVRSCPRDNVGIIAGLPAACLATSDRLDGGRTRIRTSFVVLIVVLTAAAFLNAAWMTRLGSIFNTHTQAWLGLYGTPTPVTAGTILALLILPLAIVAAVAAASRYAARGVESWRDSVTRYVPALMPLGLGMWAAHYTYHFLSGAGTIVAAAWRCAGDLGLTASSALGWACPCCAGELAPWMLPSQFFLLDLGVLTSLYVAYFIARKHHGRSRQALAAVAPWGVLLLALFVLGVVLLLEPMQMRGTLAAWSGGPP